MGRMKHQMQRDQVSFWRKLWSELVEHNGDSEEGERETERHTKTIKCYHHSEGTKMGYSKNVQLESSRTRPCTRMLV